MKPVDQTLFGTPLGNWLMACVASILEVPLESLPDLNDEIVARGGEEAKTESGDAVWWNVLQETLRRHGKIAIYYPNSPAILPPGYHIASGVGGRDLRHACVSLDGTIVHDPHPDKTGLPSVERFYLIVPLA